jgi:predicted transcriptional regulator
MQIDDIMITARQELPAVFAGHLFIDHDDAVEEAFAIMTENRVTTLPVLDPEGHVLGSVSYDEVFRRLPSQPAVARAGKRRRLEVAVMEHANARGGSGEQQWAPSCAPTSWQDER